MHNKSHNNKSRQHHNNQRETHSLIENYLQYNILPKQAYDILYTKSFKNLDTKKLKFTHKDETIGFDIEVELEYLDDINKQDAIQWTDKFKSQLSKIEFSEEKQKKLLKILVSDKIWESISLNTTIETLLHAIIMCSLLTYSLQKQLHILHSIKQYKLRSIRDYFDQIKQ